jgi:CheY-like chemotaxis protein
MAEILQSSVGPLVKVAFTPGRSGLTVSSDATQLEMALLNLAINARDAMPEGGHLLIATHEREVTRDLDLPPGRYVELSVSDTGPGMSASVAARAFEPFYTTKGVGRGTGLGLSQVYAMAKQVGGTARIEQHGPEGTTVTLWLPLVDTVVEVKAPVDKPLASLMYGGKKVLVVDDDPDVRRFLCTLLETLGFEVMAAQSGEDGLAVLQVADPDLIMVDFAMPGMNGAQMAKIVRETRPHLPMIFASGYSETAAIEAAVGKSAVLLRKPFSVSDLENVLKHVLSAG